MGLGRRTREEIVKWNQMTALRFQMGVWGCEETLDIPSLSTGELREEEGENCCMIRESNPQPFQGLHHSPKLRPHPPIPTQPPAPYGLWTVRFLHRCHPRKVHLTLCIKLIMAPDTSYSVVRLVIDVWPSPSSAWDFNMAWCTGPGACGSFHGPLNEVIHHLSRIEGAREHVYIVSVLVKSHVDFAPRQSLQSR